MYSLHISNKQIPSDGFPEYGKMNMIVKGTTKNEILQIKTLSPQAGWKEFVQGWWMLIVQA